MRVINFNRRMSMLPAVWRRADLADVIRTEED